MREASLPSEPDLAHLFQETGAAHHRAFASTNGDDPDWPHWYAEYLLPRLAASVPHLTVTGLEADFKAVDAEQRATPGSLPWPEYYARWFLARWGV